MSPPPIAVLISYCRNERPFLMHVVENALLFADLLIVSVGTRLYTGDPEDESVFEDLRVRFGFDRVWTVRYEVSDDLLSTPIVLHNESRKAALSMARRLLSNTEYADNFWALFLDADEIPGGRKFNAWWAAKGDALLPDAAYKLANYWYFLHPRLVAEPTEDSIVLVHVSQLSQMALDHPRERDGICMMAARGTVRDIMKGDPMFHHYSWVRADRAGLLRKVANWGHKHDRPWSTLLNEALDGMEERGAWPSHDFVHGYPLRLLEAPVHRLDFFCGQQR